MRINPLNDLVHDGIETEYGVEYSANEDDRIVKDSEKKEDEKPEKLDPEDNIFLFLD